MLKRLTELCIEYLAFKGKTEEELKRMEHEIPSPEEQEHEKR